MNWFHLCAPDRPMGSTPHPFDGVPKALHPAVFDIMSDLHASRADDLAAAARLAPRTTSMLLARLLVCIAILPLLACGRTSLLDDDESRPSDAGTVHAPPDASILVDGSSGMHHEDDSSVVSSDASTQATGDADAASPFDIATECLASADDIFVLEGNGSLTHEQWQKHVVQGGPNWNVHVYREANGRPSYIGIDVGQLGWEAEFSAGDAALQSGTYTNVQSAPDAVTGPGLYVSGNGVGCNSVTGQFKVIEVVATVLDGGRSAVESFTAAFEQHCDGESAANIGCVHVSTHE